MIRFIEVTQKHIDNGVPGDECKCAIALALQDEYKTTETSVEVEDQPLLYVDGIPLEIAGDDMMDDIDFFIRDFDHRDKVEPFTIKVYERAGA